MFLDAPRQSLHLLLRLLAGALAAAAAYLAVQLLAAVALAGMFSAPPDPGVPGRMVLLAMLFASTGLAGLQSTGASHLQRLRVHLARGLYINLFINRRLGAYRAENTSTR